MKAVKKSLLFWAATFLALLLAAFISIFALDALNEGPGFWQMTGAFLVHLIPTAAVLLALSISWRSEVMGALIFVGLGVAYLVLTWGEVHWSAYALISGPLFLIGLLLLTDRVYSRTSMHSFGVDRISGNSLD